MTYNVERMAKFLRRRRLLFSDPGFPTASVCLHVRTPGFSAIFAGHIAAVHAPFSRSWHFILDFSGSRKFMKKLFNLSLIE